MTVTGDMPSGLAFVQSLLIFLGVVLAAAALALSMIETGPSEGQAETRRRLGARWRDLGAMGWARVPGCVTAWFAARLDGMVAAGFETADRRIAVGGVMFGLLFVFLPVAAALNALIGGSSTLFWYYVTLAAALAVLNFIGETGLFRLVRGLVALYLGVSLMLVIPIYAVQAFTDHTINTQFTHAVLQSLLVAAFWYLAAYGAGLALDTVTGRGTAPAGPAAPGVRTAHGFLAALPVTYVLTFLALLAGHLAVLDQSPFRSWQLVLVGSGLAALSFALTQRVMAAAGERGVAGAYLGAFILSAVLSLAAAVGVNAGTARGLGPEAALNVFLGLAADGSRTYLGPDFWVSHLPMVAPLAL